MSAMIERDAYIAMVGKEVEGKTVLTPPDAKDLPGRPPWCGCRAVSVMIWDD